MKDRPCAIEFAVKEKADRPIVLVVPVTHTPPSQRAKALEIPQVTKARLGLDDQRSWIVPNESNAFRWPGPDLRPTKNGDLSSLAFGMLPPKFFDFVLERFIAFEFEARTTRVKRME